MVNELCDFVRYVDESGQFELRVVYLGHRVLPLVVVLSQFLDVAVGSGVVPTALVQCSSDE